MSHRPGVVAYPLSWIKVAGGGLQDGRSKQGHAAVPMERIMTGLGKIAGAVYEVPPAMRIPVEAYMSEDYARAERDRLSCGTLSADCAMLGISQAEAGRKPALIGGANARGFEKGPPSGMDLVRHLGDDGLGFVVG